MRIVRPAKSRCHWCGPTAGWLPPSATIRLVPPLSGPDIGETSSSSEAGSTEAISMLPRARSVEGVAFWASSTHATRNGASTLLATPSTVEIVPPAAHTRGVPLGKGVSTPLLWACSCPEAARATGPVHTCPVKLRRARRSVSRDSATPRTCRSPREALLRRQRLPVQHSRRRGAATHCYEERAEHRVRRWVLSRESEQQPHAPRVCSHCLAIQTTRTRTLVVTRRHKLELLEYSFGSNILDRRTYRREPGGRCSKLTARCKAGEAEEHEDGCTSRRKQQKSTSSSY